MKFFLLWGGALNHYIHLFLLRPRYQILQVTVALQSKSLLTAGLILPGTEIIYLVRSGFQWSTAHLSQSVCLLPSQVQGSKREPGSPLPHRRGSCPHGNPRRRRSWCPALSADHIWSPGKGFHQRSAGSPPARLWRPAEWLRMSYTLQF